MIPGDLEVDRWHGGQLLAFSAIDGPTDYQFALVARTSFEEPGIDITLPSACAFRFPVACVDKAAVAGDCFWLNAQDAGVRGAFLDTHHLLIEGPCTVLFLSDGVSCLARNGRTLIGAASHFDPSKLHVNLDQVLNKRSQWLLQRRIPSHLPQAARRTLCKALYVMKTQVNSPAGQIRHRWTTPDRWPHRDMWLWDSVFHAIGWRHIYPGLARDMISAVLDAQREDGFVPHTITPDAASEITQPPVLAFGVSLVDKETPDKSWIKELYPKLRAYIEWDLANRDTDGAGLAEWAIEGDPHCRSGESGMDNSPRFDNATRLDAVDFNSFLALECEVLSRYAILLGLKEDAVKWDARRAEICRLIASRLWSEDLGFFVDYDVDRKEQSPVMASSGFLPLICGAATTAQAKQLAQHLHDPKMFGAVFPVPSIAVRDTEHYAKDMWRGPVWINLNWLIAFGFDRYGYKDIAATLRMRTMRNIEKYHKEHGVLFEFYDDRQEVAPPELLRKGECSPSKSPYHQVIYDYGWTASLYVDLFYSTETA